MKLHARKRSSNERGSILVWVALFMIFMLAFVALGIDGAKLMATRTQLQNAADAGALAGASMIDYASGVIDQDSARTQAKATAGNNRAFIGGPAPVVVVDSDVEFPDPNQCKVTVYRARERDTAIIPHLAQVVGIKGLNTSATATAELTQAGCVFCLRPFGVFFPQPFDYEKGQEYALQEQDANAPAYYQHLDFSNMNWPGSVPPCEGGPCKESSGSEYVRCLVMNGYCCQCVEWNCEIRTQTGLATGPIRQAVDSLFSRDAVQTEYQPDETDSYPVYKAAGGNDSRVIIVPLVQWRDAGCTTGNCWVKVNGFAAFFLKRKYDQGQGPTSKEFFGEFIKFEAPGDGNGNSGTIYTVKLVK